MDLPQEYRHTFFRADIPETGWPASFAVITAWNPMGEILAQIDAWNPTGEIIPAEANILADVKLRMDLASRGIPHFRMTGGSEDFSHSEAGWAAEVPFTDALELGRRYRQLGIWWIDAGMLHLVECRSGNLECVCALSERLL